MMVQLPGQHRYGQREISAQPVDLLDCRIGRVEVAAVGEPDQQRRALVRWQRFQADGDGVVERAQVPAARNQGQASGGSRQQRPDLLVAGGVVQQQQDPLAGQMRTPHPGTLRQRPWDLVSSNPRREQQAGQGIGRFDGPVAAGVSVQLQEDLTVREVRRQDVGSMNRERALPDPGHSVDRVDTHHAAAVLHGGHQARQVGLTAGKASDVMRQHGGGGGHRPRARTLL
jgi:hypothetical protein